MSNFLRSISELIKSIFGPRQSAGSPFPPGTGPARLLVMRHAEKTGDKSDAHLSTSGRQRAQELVSYIPQQFGQPDFLIAAANSERSSRPRETLEPLASTLGLDIIDKFKDQYIDALVEHLGRQNYAGKFGVIAWRHSDIPTLIAALGAAEASYPNPWDDKVFNLIVEMTFSNAAPPRVRQIIESF